MVLTFSVVLGLSLSVFAQENSIPTWIKTTAGFWVDGKIGDKEFVQALQWLIDNDVLQVTQKDPELDKLGEEMAKRMLENALNPELPPLITISGPGGAYCIDHITGDPYDEGQAEFLLDIMNHDSKPHSPNIELQLTDDYGRPIIIKIFQIGELKPNEIKTIDEFMDFTRTANNCNAIIKEIN